MGYFLIYLFICALVGICGMNRKLGFWGYFFVSLIVTPLAGIVMVAVSDSKYASKTDSALSDDEHGAVSFAYRQAVEQYRQRIAALIRTKKISEEYAEQELEPFVRRLKTTLRFDFEGKPNSPLDSILAALEKLPMPGSEDRANASRRTPDDEKS